MTTPSAYEHAPQDIPNARRQRQRNALADTFECEPVMDQALALRKTNPSAYDALPATTKIAAGYYAVARELADGKQ